MRSLASKNKHQKKWHTYMGTVLLSDYSKKDKEVEKCSVILKIK